MTNENNKSDYNKPYMDLLKYLPEPYKSDANESLVSNLFNRFLSKQEVEKVSGYIGIGNRNAVVSRRIAENDVHRQAFQLQPVLHDKIGSVEHMASWEDIQNELERLGVDIEDFANWGAVQKFNWVPPIDINKLINYKDYYWVDDTNSAPQYITIRSRCATSSARKNFWEDLIRQYGDTFPIIDILPADTTANQTFEISLIDQVLGVIDVTGDATADILINQFFDVVNTAFNNDTYQIILQPTYDGTNNTTRLYVSGLNNGNETIGNVVTRKFNKIVFGANTTIINGDYTDLFSDGFVLFLEVSGNDELNNTFVKVISSTADRDNNTTTVEIDINVTDNSFPVDAVGSMNAQLSIYDATYRCQCGIIAGFDDGILWDDNPENPLWGDSENAAGVPNTPDGISDHQNLLDRITHNGPPTGTPADTTLWYDIDSEILYQYSSTIGWSVIWNRFDLLLEATTGTALWDQLPTCDKTIRIEAVDQWIEQNKWQHKNDITNFAAVTRATQPIIEYDWDLELNEWTFTQYNWLYRSLPDGEFITSPTTPQAIEVEPINWWELVNDISLYPNGTTVVLDARYGNLTDYFTPDKKIYIGTEGDISTYIVEYSEYRKISTIEQYRTYITFTETPSSTGSIVNLRPNSYDIYPFETSNGDIWQGYGQHWMLSGVDDSLPVPHQVENIYTPIAVDALWQPDPIYGYDIRTSLYAQEFRITDAAGMSYFELSSTIVPSDDTRPLTERSLFGMNDVRVYVSDILGNDAIRQFGTYEEVAEVVLDIIGIDTDTDEIFIPDGFTQYFPPSTWIKISDNTGIGTLDVQVASATGNRLTLVNPIPIGMTTSGVVRNITTPITSVNYPTDTFTPTSNVTLYAYGISFFTNQPAGTNVLIEVGSATMDELGGTFNKVRMEAANNIYESVGDVAVSNTIYHKIEQIKTKINQYPLFDIFTVTGDPAFKASPIFGYRTDSEYDVNTNTGLRIVYDAVNNIYEFDQFLLSEDNGELLAYRDYGSTRENFWYNPENESLYFWKVTEWDERIAMGDFYRRAVISPIEPNPRELLINGLYWYNTTTDTLYKRFISAGVGTWSEIQNFDVVVTDKNLRTIWRAGTDNDLYVPDKVDWIRRSEIEYEIERENFVTTRKDELLLEDSSLTEAEAITQANIEWYEQESNPLSLSGEWVGDWEIPDPLYYNNLHENRKYLNSRELLTHLNTIIAEQPRIPGYTGSADGMIALLPLSEINYSKGGTIKEFNDGFDTLLSSTFVNNVTPRSLIEFAHDQYETLLNSIKEIYRRNATTLLTNIEPDNILNLPEYIANETILQYEQNDQAAFIYGDTTTFTDVDGVNDLGVRNWIATLPYMNLIEAKYPTQIVDEALNIIEVVHHDGHRNSYQLSSATIDIISQIIIAAPDPRTTNDTMGGTSSSLPPNNISEFQSAFNTTISNREGVYWYTINNATQNMLYRYVVAESGISTPSSSYADGSLWMDLTQGSEVLRIKSTDSTNTVSWNVVNGLSIGDGRLHNGSDVSNLTTATVSAWQVIDLDALLNDTIFTIEKRLYDNVPEFSKLAYDVKLLPELDPVRYEKYLEETFLDYVSQLGIETPYKNDAYKSTDAFTWNYKRSVQNGGLTIISADGLTNSFLVSGDVVATFDACSASAPTFNNCPSTFSFFVKNSVVNDGTWKTLESTSTRATTFYNSTDDTTRIFVAGDVKDSLQGVIFSGVLPSLKIVSDPASPGDTPNNLNDGSESGGDWRDLYTKMYNTPYPNNEPWKLQGYTEKPLWWDDEYLNDDKTQWGDRTWKYKNGFEIINVDNDGLEGTIPTPYGTIRIAGKFVDVFVSGEQLPIDNSIDHAPGYNIGKHEEIISVNTGTAGTASIVIDDTGHTAASTFTVGMVLTIAEPTANPLINTLINEYNIVGITHNINTTTIAVAEDIGVGDITPLVSFINGAIYVPSLGNIDGYTQIKLTTIANNTNTSGRVVKVYGMWENIRIGVIPPNTVYPNNVLGVSGKPYEDTLNGLSIPDLPTFNYFSVNIGNTTISSDGGITSYPPDSVLPPYWDHISVFTSQPANIDTPIRTIFFEFSTEIVSPNSNYVFGDSGSVEWEWRTSSQFLYDQLTIAYRIDPARYVSKTFGFNYTEINQLQIDRDVKNTPSHTRTKFHGDVVNDKQFISNGLNQWYVNYNRYNGYDANFSDFSELWTGWKAPLTYQFSSFVDTPSLSIGHRFVDITNFDYSIKSKRAVGIDDFWADAFKVSIVNIPYNVARYDNQTDWRFELKTNVPISRNIKYYGVHNYQYYVNTTTNECWLYSWAIKGLDSFNKFFIVAGDQTQIFIPDSQFDIVGSTGNDSTYDVSTSSFDIVTNTTTINVNNNITSANVDGIIRANYRTIPWETGDYVYLSTTETMPIPLSSDTVIGLTKYFIIKDSDTKFRLAETKLDAQSGVAIVISTSGRGDQFVGEIISTFTATNSNTNWRYYAIDKNLVLEYNTPHEVQGMQNLVDIIHGYSVYSEDQGWVINSDKLQLDPDTSEIINWQLETERFISYAYSQRLIREQVNDRYPATVNANDNVWEFIGENKTFVTGDSVTVLSSNGVYPTPLSQNIRYYIIRDTLETFRLAATKSDAENAIAVDILSTAGVGDLQISIPREFRTLIPEFEINAFRNSIWFQPERGIVSNVITGPTEDIRTTQLIFNQNGNKINEDQLRVYRQDKETKISVIDAAGNEVLPSIINPEYSLLHLGGLHLFVDAYEHVLVLSNYTENGNLLYDPFIGLNVTKYEMIFNKQPEFTHRPNVGGYYFETFFNQGAGIRENFEAGVENLRNAYDTYESFETNLMTQYSRNSLGYEGTEDYLNNLNLSQKSQFIFWRGQIQSKGSVNAVNAFINSRRFIDAKIDDFWAVKVGEFGSAKEKEFPEIYVTTVDARSNELRLEFIDNDTDENSIDETFTPIKMSYQERWYNQPDQISVLRNNGKVMYFDTKIKKKTTAIITGSPNDIVINSSTGKMYITHNLDVDYVEITQNINNVTVELIEGTDFNIVNNNIIEFISGSGSPVTSTNDLTIWGLYVNDDAQSPSRIVDRVSDTQISPIQFWDPARNVHYSNAIHNIDLQNDIDPAKYTNSNTSRSEEYSDNWKETYVGTTWMNINKLNYLPYYSEQMVPDTTERFRQWGQLSDFGEIEIFEWVESDVHPSEWDVLAEGEEGDRTIVEHLRKSGTARKLLLEAEPNTGSPANWIPANNIIQSAYVATEGTFTGAFYIFTNVIDPTKFYRSSGVINVYINGKVYYENVDINIANTYIIPAVDLKESDLVDFVQLVPTVQADIDIEVTAGNMIQDYEYTKVDFFDALGTPYSKYYFWVYNKRTKTNNKNRTMPIAEAAIQLSSIPSAHMFFQNIKPSSSVQQDVEGVSRAETHVYVPGSPIDQSFALEIEPAADTTILVEVNGVEQPNDPILYSVGGSPVAVTISLVVTADPNDGNVPLVANDIVKISYTGVYEPSVELPYRYTQVIIRGLQGIVNADNRYTIRFNRDFTLRDTITNENVGLEPLDMKSLHEEWKIFRQEQQYNIDRWLWDRVTECIVGFKLTDTNVRVPSFERELYDEKFNTDTQYGLGDNQAFANGSLALNSILAYLLDPTVDFNPIDINTFFINNSFDTTENIIKAMDEIYNTFIFTNINRMFFSVLYDAFTTKAKYPGIFKTSMVSLHGIRPFQTNGVFDD